MARKMDVDWSDWKGHVEQPVHPLSRPLSKGIKTGADSAKEALTTGNLPVIADAPPQPTNEQLFGHLVVTEEMAKKAEHKWNNRFNEHFAALNQPIDHLNKSKLDDKKWGLGKSFNSMLTKEELAKRNSEVGED